MNSNLTVKQRIKELEKTICLCVHRGTTLRHTEDVAFFQCMARGVQACQAWCRYCELYKLG